MAYPAKNITQNTFQKQHYVRQNMSWAKSTHVRGLQIFSDFGNPDYKAELLF